MSSVQVGLFRHPNSLYEGIGINSDGVIMMRDSLSGKWYASEKDITVPACGRRTFSAAGNKKFIHRFALECYLGRELDYQEYSVTYKNHYINDISKENLKILSFGEKKRLSGYRFGWATRAKDGSWELRIGKAGSSLRTFEGFSSEAEARSYFNAIVNLNGKDWMMGLSNRIFREPTRSSHLKMCPPKAERTAPVSLESSEDLLFNKNLPRWRKNPDAFTIVQVEAAQLLRTVFNIEVHHQRLGEWAEMNRGPRCKRHGRHWLYSYNSLEQWANLTEEERKNLRYDPVTPSTELEFTIKKIRDASIPEDPAPVVISMPAESGVLEDLQKRLQQVEIENEQLKAQLITQAREFSEIKNSMTQLKSFLLEALK